MTTDEFTMNLVLLGFSKLNNYFYSIPGKLGVGIYPNLKTVHVLKHITVKANPRGMTYQEALDIILELLDD